MTAIVTFITFLRVLCQCFTTDTAKHLEVTKMSKDIVPKVHALLFVSLTCSHDLCTSSYGGAK
jgi:hypothetical protein